MPKTAHKVAILHRDGATAARAARLATAAGLDVMRPASFDALVRNLADPLLTAIVTDLPPPRDGGFDMLEHLHTPTAHPTLIIITDPDRAAAENVQRMAAAKGLDLTAIPSHAIDETALKRLLADSQDRAPRFGPADIDDCIEKGHFRVEYQPKVSLLSTSAESQFGVEALCRMQDPRFGTISPDLFIPMAEKSGLIPKLTDAVVCASFQAWRMWSAAGLRLRLALNVSPLLLSDTEWAQSFLKRVAEYGMEPKWVTLEITESAAGATSPKAVEILTHLQKKGFALSIDDFGTGFSSLASLYRLPIAEMKIDKSFILDLQGKEGARSLVESAIGMAKRMGIKVVAEGVETQSVFEELRRIGCHEVQGFFVGRSMPADAVVSFFTGWRKAMTDAPAAKGLPKIAILQALLNDIVGDRSLDMPATVIAGPYRGQTNVAQNRQSPAEAVRKIPSLVLEGKSIAALALCHTVVRQLQNLSSCAELRTKIAQLQAHLEEDITTATPLEIYSPGGMFRLLPQGAVSLGRPSAAVRVDIPIKCRWFSSGEKNLRLFTKDGGWFLEDLGSSHGYYIDDAKLHARRPFELPIGKTLVEVRQASGAVAPLALLFRRTPLNPDAIAISFDYEREGLRGNLGEKDWAELEGDLDCTWIVGNGKIDAGNSSNCALLLADCSESLAATIHFDKGYSIAPANSITIDDTAFEQIVPLPVKSELNLGGSRLVVREASGNEPVQAKSVPASSYRARLG